MKEIDFIKHFLLSVKDNVVTLYRNKNNIDISTKKDATDFLTEADIMVQKRFVEELKKFYPNDLIVGEELGLSDYHEGISQRVWIIDPIDGTGNFVRSYFPIFAVALAFAVNREIQASGVLVPMLGDLFWAERGQGAWRNENRISVSSKAKLAESCIQVDFGRRMYRRERLPYFIEPICEAGVVRCIGSAILSLVQVALGVVDGYVHAFLDPWDYVAGQLLIEEAGGKVTQADGTPLQLFHKNKGIIASNGLLHEELLGVIQRGLNKS